MLDKYLLFYAVYLIHLLYCRAQEYFSIQALLQVGLQCSKLLILDFLIFNEYIHALLYYWRSIRPSYVSYMPVVCIYSLSLGTGANISSLPSKLGSQKGSLRCYEESPLKLQWSGWRYSILIHRLVVISWRETVNVETRVCTCTIDIKCLPILDSLSSPSNVLLLLLHLNPQNLPILCADTSLFESVIWIALRIHNYHSFHLMRSLSSACFLFHLMLLCIVRDHILDLYCAPTTLVFPALQAQLVYIRFDESC